MNYTAEAKVPVPTKLFLRRKTKVGKGVTWIEIRQGKGQWRRARGQLGFEVASVPLRAHPVCHASVAYPYGTAHTPRSPPSFAGFFSFSWPPSPTGRGSLLPSLFCLCSLSGLLSSQGLQCHLNPDVSILHTFLKPRPKDPMTQYAHLHWKSTGHLKLTCLQQNFWFQTNPIYTQALIHTCSSSSLSF